MYESWSSCYLNCLILSPVTHRRHCGHFKKWIKPFLWKCRCQKFTPCNDNVQFCILHFTQILNIPSSSLILIKTRPCSFIKTRPFFFIHQNTSVLHLSSIRFVNLTLCIYQVKEQVNLKDHDPHVSIQVLFFSGKRNV